MAWINGALLSVIAGLLIVVIFAGSPGAWSRVRFLAVFALEMGSITAASLVLVTVAQLATASVPPHHSEPAAGLFAKAALNSLFLLLASLAWGSAVGFGGALALTLLRRRLGWLALLATVLWVLPTFIFAIGIEELQAQIFSATSIVVTGGYGVVTPFVVFWAGSVLGLRPAAYIFRRARLAFEEEMGADHVRTAFAGGLRWRVVALRSVVRPALPIAVNAWLISVRLLVGSIPLVEYFFAYPGLGRLFISSLGLQNHLLDSDIVIGAVVLLAALLLLLEGLGGFVQQMADPRLRDHRAGEAVS